MVQYIRHPEVLIRDEHSVIHSGQSCLISLLYGVSRECQLICEVKHCALLMCVSLRWTFCPLRKWKNAKSTILSDPNLTLQPTPLLQLLPQSLCACPG